MGGNQISVKMPDLGQPLGAICVKLDAITYDHFGKEAVTMCAKLMTKGPWSGPTFSALRRKSVLSSRHLLSPQLAA